MYAHNFIANLPNLLFIQNYDKKEKSFSSQFSPLLKASHPCSLN